MTPCMAFLRHTGFVLAAAALTCCSDVSEEPLHGMSQRTDWIQNPSSPLPLWLSDTGIYEDLSSLTPSTAFITYVPRFELHSHGAGKSRLLHLPPNTSITRETDGSWTFPVGTIAVKTFTLDEINDRDGATSIETRIIMLRDTGWVYAVYHWNVEGTQARKLSRNWSATRFDLIRGTQRLSYEIPGALDCQTCHDTHPNSALLGWSPLNFDETLAKSSVFDTEPEPIKLPARNEFEARAMGFLIANCGHCHHGLNVDNENASYSLLPDRLIENTVDVETASSASGIGIRVVAGKPEESAIYLAAVDAMTSDYKGDLKPMPPVGLKKWSETIALILADWIEGL